MSHRMSTSMPKYWWIRMSRRPAIFCQSMLGSLARRSAGSCLTASPMTSRLRTTASSVLSSPAKPCFESPFVYRLILPIAPRMSSRWTLKSRGMQGFFEDRLPKSWLDRLAEDEVHPAPEQPLQEGLQVHVGVEGLGLELDHEIEIAVLLGRAPGCGAEETKAPNAVSPDDRRALLEAMEDLVCAQGH